jgi:hypothetical protein
MIRVATSARRRRICEELTLPSPARIERLTAEIQKTWSPAKRARRAGHARRVQVMMVAAMDLFGRADVDED